MIYKGKQDLVGDTICGEKCKVKITIIKLSLSYSVKVNMLMTIGNIH